MKTAMFWWSVLVIFACAGSASGQGQCVALDVPYIHQVFAMNQEEFLGHNACGPTCAVIILSFFGLAPPNPTNHVGYYVYSGYSGYSDYSGESYNSLYAKGWAGPPDGPNKTDGYGAHGYIIEEDSIGNWQVLTPEKISGFLRNHGLLVSDWNYSDLMATVQAEVSAGRPLIGHVTIPVGRGYGHYVAITGIAGPNQIVVNDPYGDYTKGYWGKKENGKNAIYDIDAVKLDRVITIKPGSSLVGLKMEYGKNSYCQKIIDCYNRLGGEAVVGWPISDQGNPGYVHNWAPYRYLCQNFRNERGEESIIIYDPIFGDKAYRIAGKFWEYYRYGRWDVNLNCQRYGPDMPMDDGQVLGAPISDAGNGLQFFVGGYLKSGSVQLHRWDGTLVEIYQPSGKFSSLTLSGQAMSENHNALEWEGGPTSNYYAVLADGTEIGQTNLHEFTEAGLPTGTTRQYQIQAKSFSGEVLDSSNVISITGPGNQGVFYLKGEAIGNSRIRLDWEDTVYPYAPFLWLYRDGVRIEKLIRDFDYWEDANLEPGKSYRYQLALLTASEIILAYSNVAGVATLPGPPPPLPVPNMINISCSKTSWICGESAQLTAKVYDQFGNQLSGLPLLFYSGEPLIMEVSLQEGICTAVGVGTTTVWAELADDRQIKSSKLSLTVKSQPQPKTPGGFTVCGIQLYQPIELTANQPYLERSTFSTRVKLYNPNTWSASFYEPAVFIYSVAGQLVSQSSYLGRQLKIPPKSSVSAIIPSTEFPAKGDYFLMIHLRPWTGSTTDWRIVSKGYNQTPTKLVIKVISTADLLPNLAIYGGPSKLEFRSDEEVTVETSVLNCGKNLAVASQLLISSQFAIQTAVGYQQLAVGEMINQRISLGRLPPGDYQYELYLDPANNLVEESEDDNCLKVSFTVVESVSLILTKVPELGSESDYYLQGLARGVNLSDYGVAVYLKFGGVWYPKPDAGCLAEIDSSGRWSQLVVTDTNDISAIEYACYLVPKNLPLPECWPELCLEKPDLPSAAAYAGTVRELGPKPQIIVSEVPPLNSVEPYLCGFVDQVNSELYELWTFIKVGGVWYPKPDAGAATPIWNDNSFCALINTDTYDQTADQLIFFLVRKGNQVPVCWPDLCLELPKIDCAVLRYDISR